MYKYIFLFYGIMEHYLRKESVKKNPDPSTFHMNCTSEKVHTNQFKQCGKNKMYEL